MQPIQQHGRRLPSSSSVTVRSTWFFRVSGSLLVIVQQIHSLRASGVRSSQRSSADSSATSALRKSSGTLCTTPSAIFLVIHLLYQVFVCFNIVHSLAKPYYLLSMCSQSHIYVFDLLSFLLLMSQWS